MGFIKMKDAKTGKEFVIHGSQLPDLSAQATGSPIYWRSCAEWPEGLILNVSGEGRNVTKDRHDTKEQADGVCDLLRREGFGGERCHFPVRTWTEPVYSENDKEDGSNPSTGSAKCHFCGAAATHEVRHFFTGNLWLACPECIDRRRLKSGPYQPTVLQND